MVKLLITVFYKNSIETMRNYEIVTARFLVSGASIGTIYATNLVNSYIIHDERTPDIDIARYVYSTNKQIGYGVICNEPSSKNVSNCLYIMGSSFVRTNGHWFLLC